MAAQLRILAVFHRGLDQSLVLSVAQAILLLPANGWLVHLLPGRGTLGISGWGCAAGTLGPWDP